MKQEIYCEYCNWQGKWSELMPFEKSAIQLCPDCGKPDSICEEDAVNFNDEYYEQERIIINE